MFGVSSKRYIYARGTFSHLNVINKDANDILDGIFIIIFVTETSEL